MGNGKGRLLVRKKLFFSLIGGDISPKVDFLFNALPYVAQTVPTLKTNKIQLCSLHIHMQHINNDLYKNCAFDDTSNLVRPQIVFK